ncbi:MAG: S8 family serine peptidase [Halapricum sp.]
MTQGTLDRLTRRQVLQGVGATGITGLVRTKPAGAAEGRAPPDRHIVGVDPGRADVAERKANGVHRVLDFEDIGQAVSGWFPDEAIENLQGNPNVRYVEAEGEMHAIAQTTPWGIDRVDADVLHDEGETGNGADIAVIDTGIDDDHPDLQANVGDGKAYVDCTGSNCNYDWSDDNNHGTHCAGIADAVDNSEGVVGISTGATLHAVKVLDDSGAGYWSDVAAGIEYAANQGWDVGSLSLGASSGSSTVEDACQYADDKGVLLVAAAGNDGPCSDCVGYPAAYSTVMAVSSTDSDDSLSSFSSTGPEVELAAPGGGIYSTVIDDYATYSGTSMACPHVSGAGGQLMADGYTNAEARNQLNSTAEDIGLGDNEQGSGLLDAEAAVLGSDSAPSVSWVNPSDGETVSSTITVQIDAVDSEDNDDSLDVTYNVDGGSSRSTTYTSGYYEDSWDTTGVSDGDHTLAATATDSAGNTSSSSITVTTDNTEIAPTVDSLSASEVETSDSDAEFDVSWDVSDADGDLDSVDLTLTGDTAGETEDSATVSVSGDTASGTTRLVAVGDDGSGNSYTVDATVTDGAGTTASATASTTESESAPAVDSLSASEVETSDSDAEFDVSWDVSDADGDLDSVDLTLTGDTAGETEDSATVSVSGDTASGTTRLVAVGDDGSGNSYTVEMTVTDSYGNTGSGSTSVGETEDTNSAPSASIDSLNDRSNPAWDRFTVDWSASDSDGNLDTVVVELLDSSGSVLDSASDDISGSSASGSNEVRSKQSGAEVVVTATDTDSLSGSDSQSI